MNHSTKASFTGQTLRWFEEGEEIAASERQAAARRARRRRGRLGSALGMLVALAIVGFAAVVVAQHYGLLTELPWELELPGV
jgi:hypothetical protein